MREEGKIMRISQFTTESNIENINLFKLEKFIKESDLVKKLNGFFDKINQMQAQAEVKVADDEDDDFLGVDRHRPALGIVNSFLEALNSSEDDGRVILSINGNYVRLGELIEIEKNFNKSYIKYLLLNPESHFTEVLEQARAVILAGGTMQPVSKYQCICLTM
jgi:chromosome transmission fidelity protein 1